MAEMEQAVENRENSDSEMDDMETEDNNVEDKEEEELEFDDTAYVMYHQANLGSPCLSFDVLLDDLGDDREEFPLTLSLVAGSQSPKDHNDIITVMKMSNLQRIKHKTADDSDSDSSESEDEDDKPDLETTTLNHPGCVNRIRATEINNKKYAATWSMNGKVYIWDLSKPYEAINDTEKLSYYIRNCLSPDPIFNFSGHHVEGYALDWSRITPGQLASGDCNKNIYLWKLKSDSSWCVEPNPYSSHSDSVEDIQWSPTEANVFASCSVDKSIKVWDARTSPAKACMLTCSGAHEADVNVIHWNRNDPFLVSGGDDGVIKIWDLRQFQHHKPSAIFKHHSAPITSVEWHPTDNSVFAASGEDNMISLWDMAVERDTEDESSSKDDENIPAQLLFIHQGQNEIKEVHWHRQMPGVVISTALGGFNVFRTISV
ncbi:glutamate-rich WD repeat-containing protein 1 [Octopus bimaculoides]|uniref:Glutamate-rich WD repeat-containing protein 1 n=1 Tax=Octopus bimaculoides TaxID=37653 RepID=A0A0L8I9P4_OCTBM|nr:glutamate-rich WD repeat-containing protein 1 [Octopus bimaculoides]|eukprot:XP_014783500.1 PREDICTED: glutamate-rich WD repeat-containing protein 1-like [Octopus bimaculoides]